jgi:hypothetical protein
VYKGENHPKVTKKFANIIMPHGTTNILNFYAAQDLVFNEYYYLCSA